MNSGPRRGMTPEDITRIRWVSDVQISPDGGRVAFVVTTLSEERDAYLANIWMVAVDGGEARRLTSGGKRDGAPRWSPDGRRLAFVSERQEDSRPQLYVLPTDGGEAERLTEQEQGVSEPVWSPDGRRLAFLSRIGGNEPLQEEAAGAVSRPARIITTLKYKLNGEGFVYDRRTHLFVVDTVAGSVSQITSGDYNHDGPAWSPDGNLLAFTSARHAERDEDDAADVWVVGTDGGDARRVTDTAGPVARPSFSPDGQTIAYLGHAQRFDAGYNWRVYTVPTGGGVSVCVTAGMDRSCLALGGCRPLWSADGRRLTIGVQNRGDIQVCRFDARNMGAPEVVAGGSRQVTGLSATADGSLLAFSATDPTNPAEVFVCKMDGSHERQLTNLNAGWKAEVTLSAPERLAMRARRLRSGRLGDEAARLRTG